MRHPHILCIDGNSLAHRAWHSHPGLTDDHGRPTGMLVGFCSILARLIEITACTHLVVGFDDHTGNWRKERWPHYKAGREEHNWAFGEEMSRLQNLLRALGLCVIVPHHGEADDVLGRTAATARREGVDCTLATSDRDALALVGGPVKMLKINNGIDNAVLLDEGKVLESYGVVPARYTEYAALRGDTSDNLPGVPGIGEKTAAKLLRACGGVDEAIGDPAAASAAIGERLAQRLFEHRDRIAMNRQIMTIDGAPDIDLEIAKLRGDRARCSAVLESHGLRQAARRLPGLVAPGA